MSFKTYTNRIQHDLEYLRERYRYEPETGLLISRKTGLPVGSVSGNKGLLLTLQLNGRQIMYRVHRLIVFLCTGEDPVGFVVYHRDGNNCNNRLKNLGVDDPANNSRNCIHQIKLGKQYGVTVSGTGKRTRYQARIKVNGKGIYLGRYKTFEEAVAARTKAEIQFGFNMRHELAM
jgi:hypothetical protein